MKPLQLIALLLIALSAASQSPVGASLGTVRSIEDAEQFVRSHPQLQSVIEIHNSGQDTTDLDKQLYNLKVGEVLSIGNHTYKLIGDTLKYAFRASYIYLDGSTMSKNAIDSLRELILHRYSAGESFDKLADDFTMDGNKNHGDLGYFVPGMMVKEFEAAVRSHAAGEVFTVNVPANRWYYVVKKTMVDRVTREITVLGIHGMTPSLGNL